jgi:15-cis-phytoene desaturase
MRALVMGGGMSGLAAAINLLDLGYEVRLIEADEIFGGRASSWLDEDGDMIDNALHVFMPYYVNLLAFFERMGIAGNIVWKDSAFYYAQPNGDLACLKFAKLPAPLHAGYAMGYLLKDFRGIPFHKLVTAALPMGFGIMNNLHRLDELDEISMETFMARYGAAETMKPLMEPAINGLTFTPSYQISAKVMLNWFLKMFVSAKNSRIGFANGGLGEIWVDNCLDYIREKGGVAELGMAVTSINIADREITSVTVNDSEELTADLYVSGMSPYSLRRLLPDECYALEYFRDLWHFQYAPSLSIQIWFDRKLTDIDCTFFSNECVFNTYADLSNVLPHIFSGGSMLEMVISPADHVQGLPDQVIFGQCIEQIKGIFPAAREAEVRKWKVVRQRQGVYRAYPGMEKHRPFQRSPYSNLYLTGDFTETHVSSGGMEAAIWTANKMAELVSMDKLGRNISLNEEYKPFNRLVRAAQIVRYVNFALMALVGLGLARRLLKGRSEV